MVFAATQANPKKPKELFFANARQGYVVVNEGELIFILEKATQKIVDAVIKEKPQKVIALDRLIKDNDQLKTNTSLQMKDAGIEFKTI